MPLRVRHTPHTIDCTTVQAEQTSTTALDRVRAPPHKPPQLGHRAGHVFWGAHSRHRTNYQPGPQSAGRTARHVRRRLSATAVLSGQRTWWLKFGRSSKRIGGEVTAWRRSHRYNVDILNCVHGVATTLQLTRYLLCGVRSFPPPRDAPHHVVRCGEQQNLLVRQSLPPPRRPGDPVCGPAFARPRRCRHCVLRKIGWWHDECNSTQR